MAVRLVLVDDHLLFSEGLKYVLHTQADFQVVGEAAEAREAYRVVEATAPDAVIVDIALPGTNGIAVTRELTRRKRDTKILILTMHGEEEFVAQSLSAGALGYALKHQKQTEIFEAIRCVARGQTYLCPSISRAVVDSYRRERQGLAPGRPLGVLSPREHEVFDLLVRGYSNDAIGAHLCISVKTVETHRAHILRKIGVHSLVDLVRFAAKHNLISDRGVA
jgi:two-component system response regulator NreC